jgi:hypothetical protein
MTPGAFSFRLRPRSPGQIFFEAGAAPLPYASQQPVFKRFQASQNLTQLTDDPTPKIAPENRISCIS